MGAPATIARSRGGATQKAEHGSWPEWIDSGASERLRQSIREHRLAHAYLLSGPNGVGKAALSQAFAQALCCMNPNPDDASQFCGDCRACRNINRGSHPDVEFFSLESEARLAEKPGRMSALGIDTIRRLRASVALMPLESSHRILIIEDAETLPEPAQQALLKVLEEPPASVMFVLLADEPESLLETVQSRCQAVSLRPAVPALIEKMLLERGVQSSLATEIASLSEGRAAWAVAAAADAKILKSRRDDRDAARAWVLATPYERLVTAYKLGGLYTKKRGETVRRIQSVVALLRDEMIRLASPERSPVGASSLQFSGDVSAMQVARALASSLRCLDDLDRNVRPRLALEAMVLAWPNSRTNLT